MDRHTEDALGANVCSWQRLNKEWPGNMIRSMSKFIGKMISCNPWASQWNRNAHHRFDPLSTSNRLCKKLRCITLSSALWQRRNIECDLHENYCWWLPPPSYSCRHQSTTNPFSHLFVRSLFNQTLSEHQARQSFFLRFPLKMSPIGIKHCALW